MNQLKCFTRVMVQVLLLIGLAACSDATKTTEQADAANTTQTPAKPQEQTQEQQKLSFAEQQAKHQQIKQDMLSNVQGLELQGKDKLKEISGGQCADKSQQACLSSAGCMLSQDKDKKYECRAAKNGCEVGFVQSSGTAKNVCEGKKDCKFSNASCFCPEGVQCVCGGGAPAMCSSTSIY
jgi:hypothetical protein